MQFSVIFSISHFKIQSHTHTHDFEALLLLSINPEWDIIETKNNSDPAPQPVLRR
jgi:hypothetical protein